MDTPAINYPIDQTILLIIGIVFLILILGIVFLQLFILKKLNKYKNRELFIKETQNMLTEQLKIINRIHHYCFTLNANLTASYSQTTKLSKEDKEESFTEDIPKQENIVVSNTAQQFYPTSKNIPEIDKQEEKLSNNNDPNIPKYLPQIISCRFKDLNDPTMIKTGSHSEWHLYRDPDEDFYYLNHEGDLINTSEKSNQYKLLYKFLGNIDWNDPSIDIYIEEKPTYIFNPDSELFSLVDKGKIRFE